MIIGILAFGGLALGATLATTNISSLNYFIIMGIYCINLLIFGIILNQRRKRLNDKEK
jgi:putative Mn2+ efflux pump MntP